jgi:hypothetical protein
MDAALDAFALAEQDRDRGRDAAFAELLHQAELRVAVGPSPAPSPTWYRQRTLPTGNGRSQCSGRGAWFYRSGGASRRRAMAPAPAGTDGGGRASRDLERAMGIEPTTFSLGK